MTEDLWGEEPPGASPTSSAPAPPSPTTETEPGTLAAWIEERRDELRHQYLNPGTVIRHVPTGLRRLDDAGLLETGIVTTLLAAAGEGKTVWSFQFLRGAAEAGHRGLGLFPEDPRDLLADRLIARELDVNAFALRRGRAGKAVPDNLEHIDVPWARLVEVDDRRYSHQELKSRIEKFARAGGRLVVLDYLQVAIGKVGSRSKEETISDFIWDLGELAKDTNVAVLLLSQVGGHVMEHGRKTYDQWKFNNRGAGPSEEMVEGYRPHAHDAAWAPTAVFQKSRCVLTSFRPGYWMRQHRANVRDDSIELTVAKSNYGVSMETMRFNW